VTAKSKLPKPPPSLVKGGGGERLWYSMHEAYDSWEPDRLAILQSACELQDAADRLTQAWHDGETIVLGAAKQPAVNPCAAEARHSRAEIARLLKACLAPAPAEQPEETAGPMDRSTAGRVAAHARWHGHRKGA